MPLGPIDPHHDRSKYLQIADRLREAIAAGDYAVDERLPSERELGEIYGVTRETTRRAIEVLKQSGLVESIHGKGLFVRPRPPVKRVAHDRFARRHRRGGRAAYLVEIEESGRTPEVEVLEVGPGQVPAGIAERLGVRPGAKVLVRRRRYLADGQPMELATSYVPWALAKGTPMLDENPGPGGIYARIEDAGHPLASFAEEVSARMPDPDEARSLHLPAGVPVINVVRSATAKDGTVVEVCDTVMAADRYVLSYELPAT